MSRYTEADLILPAIYLMSTRDDKTITTTQLKDELRDLLKPEGEDREILKGRRDDKFSQKVRNLVSHNTLVRFGFATYENKKFKLTQEGEDYLNEESNLEYINEHYNNYEGFETLNTISAQENIDDIYPTKLNIGREQFSVFELKRKHENGKLLLDPDFQRKGVWNTKQKSELVESVLMNIPLPFIYLNENKSGELVVVDGRQRLSSLFDFLNDKFRLHKKLNILSDLHGKKFTELPLQMQSLIEDYQLVTHIIKPPTSDRVIIDIFDRVNRSGTILNNQEIRNALYQGKSTKLLEELANSQTFKLATGNSIRTDRMKDKYLIVRFLSFYIWRIYKFYINNEEYDYKGDTEDFLAKYMQYINNLNDEEINELRLAFERAMSNSFEILGENAFRLPNKKDPTKKRPVSMALFESLSYLMADNRVKDKQSIVKSEFEKLLNEEDFLKTFLSIDSTVKDRFSAMDNIRSKL